MKTPLRKVDPRNLKKAVPAKEGTNAVKADAKLRYDRVPLKAKSTAGISGTKSVKLNLTR